MHDNCADCYCPDFRRYQLSTLVNRLLETDKAIPLEFLINGQFLRTSLDDFLTSNGISAETTLSVEYVRALIPPLPVASYSQDDWISAVDVLSPSFKAADSVSQPRIFTAAFDGALRVWNTSGDTIATGIGHQGPVRDVRLLTSTRAVSSGADRTIRLWDYVDAAEPSTNASLSLYLELYGHTSAVNRLAVSTKTSRMLSASADHTVGLWSTQKSGAPAASEELLQKSASSKRRKLTHPIKQVASRGPLSLMSGHQAQVSAVCFDERDPTVGYSASWDHSVKTWDLTTSTCVDTRTTSQSLFSLAHLPDVSLLATGTAGRNVTLIDPRASATTVSALTLKGHTNAVSSITKDPTTTYHIASGSHDGTCRVWDIRSVRSDTDGKSGEAVYIIDRESAKGSRRIAGEDIKIFDVAWDADVGIVSVGEDKKVQINKSN